MEIPLPKEPNINNVKLSGCICELNNNNNKTPQNPFKHLRKFNTKSKTSAFKK